MKLLSERQVSALVGTGPNLLLLPVWDPQRKSNSLGTIWFTGVQSLQQSDSTSISRIDSLLPGWVHDTVPKTAIISVESSEPNNPVTHPLQTSPLTSLTMSQYCRQGNRIQVQEPVGPEYPNHSRCRCLDTNLRVLGVKQVWEVLPGVLYSKEALCESRPAHPQVC